MFSFTSNQLYFKVVTDCNKNYTQSFIILNGLCQMLGKQRLAHKTEDCVW
jgi:hypothetical protein